jgi:hypothetical protein
MMGDAVPQAPWDLPLLFSRMDAFRFTRCGDCRTIDLLARRTGQRGDATRAPMQVRNGWRPHGRLLAQQPAALSKDCRFFVQPTRTTSDYAVQLRLLPAYSSVFCETLPYHPAIGLIAMFAAPLVTVEFAPHRVFLVPCLGLVFFAPVVLMPLRRKGGKSDA